MADDYTHIAWVDFETSGLSIKHDHIFEVGFVLTDLEFTELGWFDALVFDGTYVHFQQVAARLAPAVREMHTVNGLLQDLDQSFQGIGPDPRPIYRWADVDTCLVAICDRYAEPGKVIMGGSGVARFDKPFSERCFPQFVSKLHYGELDISNIRRFIKILGLEWMLPAQGEKVHRAMADTMDHLEQARGIGDFLVRAATLKGMQ